MPLIEFETRPDVTQLRRFASIGLPFVLGLAAVLAWRRGSDSSFVLATLAIVAMVLGRMRPEWFRPLYVAGLALTFPVAWLGGYVLLAAVYFLLITPIGLILRLLRRDPLARRFDREAQSYWVARPASDDRTRYFRQY